MHLVIFRQLTYLINLDLNLMILVVLSLLTLKTIFIQLLLHLAIILYHFKLLSLWLKSLIRFHPMGHHRQWLLHHRAHCHSIILIRKRDHPLCILHLRCLEYVLLLLVLILHLPEFARDTFDITRLLPV